ncbi:glycosyltransferase [Photobacterium atrarenae]|uniref:Glycosyltransferase n=1 Tax=Photobacterium atrarenae TaxID=865757 RepID=A0ABY5GC08_9GAMM|nr:glycosyltransferase [Photobacterium atrarenae]UTV26730.1 glycosyltransferase [Photobacterium atrarenae]
MTNHGMANQRMKKIGYVIPTFPVLSETFIGVEMRAMMRKGHDVQPFAFAGTEHYQPADHALVARCQYIPTTLSAGALRHLVNMASTHKFLTEQQGFSYFSLLKQGAILAELARRAGCDHLHAHFAWHSAATAIVAAKLLGISVSLVGHGADIYAAPEDLNSKLNHIDFGCAVTQDMMRHLQTRTSTRIHYVACGLEPSHYPPLNPDWVPGKDFLFIGRLVEKKGIDTLVEAFARLPTTTALDIVGDGPLMPGLQRTLQERGLTRQIRLLGAQNADWLREHAGDYKALVAPFCIAANGDRDTGPLVIKEAMGLGLPVITSDLAGCNEILDPQSGLQVPMQNASALAQMMAQVLGQPFTALSPLRTQAYQRVFDLYNADLHAGRLSCLVEGA